MIDGLAMIAAIGAMKTTGVPSWIPTATLSAALQHATSTDLVITRYRHKFTLKSQTKDDFLKPLLTSRGTVTPELDYLMMPLLDSFSIPTKPSVDSEPMTVLNSKTAPALDLTTPPTFSKQGEFSTATRSEVDYLGTILEPKTTETPVAKTYAAGQPFVEPPFIGETKNVSLALSGTPLESVVSLLGKQVGINIVLLSKADQKVTVNLHDMNLMEAMKHIAAISGLKVLKVKNTLVMAEEGILKGAYPKDYEREYGVTPPSGIEANSAFGAVAQPAKDVNRILTTNFQSAMRLTTALKDFLATKKVSIVALPSTLVPTIDIAAGPQSTSGAAGALTAERTAEETGSRKILLSGPKQEVEDAVRLIEEMDVARQQVDITVTIHDVSNDALKEEGFSWNLGQFSVSETNNSSINFGTFNRTGLSFQSTMKALEQNDRAKLLASPNISAMDGIRAFILIGERRQFPVVNGTTPNGQFIFSTQEQNIGIYLQVAADIAADGTITLAVKPQVSAIIGFLQLNGGSYPQVSTRESHSTLTLKDGQTMLMGGLLRDEEIKNLEQVPLLSRIPLFGELFRYRRSQKRSSQLIISITPKIVKQ